MLVVGALPPPVTGQTLALETLIDALRQRAVPHRMFDLSERTGTRFNGTFSMSRGVQFARLLVTYLPTVLGRDRTLYLTVAQSWVGFVRDLCTIWPAALRRHRIVLHMHGGGFRHFYDGLSRWKQYVVLKTWRRASRIIVLGDSLRSMLDWDSVLRERITVVPNTVPDRGEVEITQGRAIRRDAPLRILYLSNLVPSKGYLLVLEAVRTLVDRGFDVEADFCGEFLPQVGATFEASQRHDKDQFWELVSQGGLGDRVRWHGVVRGDTKRAILANADFFVLPTAYPNEGQPISVIEALSYGVVPVCTAHAGIPEMLDGGRAGVLVEREPAAIAEAIECLLADPGRYRALSDAGVRRYLDTFHPNAHVSALMDHLLGRPVPAPQVAEPRA